YCVSCDWSELVTWYKAVVNSLVPCDLCDHAQILHVVSNDVTSDILLTTLHVITDWPISDHMIGTSYRGPVQRSQPAIFKDFRRGRDLHVNNTDLSPVSSCTLLC
ncbi:unnamed protein product, partial [Staurois parvus]